MMDFATTFCLTWLALSVPAALIVLARFRSTTEDERIQFARDCDDDAIAARDTGVGVEAG